MIYDYVIGMIFYIVFILFLYFVGSSILKNDSEPYRFLTGYLIYSVLIGVGGIIIQQLNTSWNVFFGYFILVVIILLIFSFYKIKKENIKLFPLSLKKFLKNYWFLFVISLILIVISLSYQDWIWLNNCLDDGQYLNKMATLPYIDNPFIIAPATGLLGSSNIFRLDVFTTGELENSVYMFLTQVTPSIFARIFMSGFNYFLLVNCIFVFAEKIIKSCNINYNKSTIQYISCIVILFIFNWDFLNQSGIIMVQDSWQFNTAMYYGSSIVRTMGIMLIIIHFIDKEKIGLKDVLIVLLISIALTSKSIIALPVIFTSGVAYLLSTYIISEKKYRFIAIMITFILIVIGTILGNTEKISSVILTQISYNIDNWFLVLAVIILLVSFSFKSKVVTKCNLTILIIGILIIFDPINNIFEKLSVYDFVAARNLTTLIYTMIIMVSIYIYILLNKLEFMKNKLVLMYSLSTILLIIGALGSAHIYEGSILSSYKTVWQNKAIIPSSTIKLGSKLTTLANQRNKAINVIMPEGVMADGDMHSVAIIIRTFAPQIRSISAIGRFGTCETGAFADYNADEQRIFDNFLVNPNTDTADELEKMLLRYPINCIVLPTSEDNLYLESMGFESFDKIDDINAGVRYNIYYKK
ncbi:hypothetical protein SAMN04489758_11741 [Thomasclavelia cocleata]|uniref:Uncharacterized protein n=2 Tax=Thomasclavelia cocleata TaxID=69824 RepID=A0A1I0FAZ6_9FIRM|nr:hypothetical protein SAMN04489758_11741 [Thomasclavelia cocleata]